MPTIPTNEPLELRAGLTWAWRREDLSVNYPANAGWALKYWFKKTGSTGANFSIDATADGINFAVSVLASTTAAFTAGDYSWAAVVTKGAEVYQTDSGRLKVLARYDQAANLDDRSHARKMLEAIESALEGKASSSQLDLISFTIGTRAQQRDVAKLLPLRDRYKAEVEGEDAAAALIDGRGNPRIIRTRFDRA